jgi:hypothetical protein
VLFDRLGAALIAAGLASYIAPPAHAVVGAFVNIDTRTTLSIPAGFSGLNAPQPRNGVEYFDPKLIAAVQLLKPGWLRFPAGTASMDFDWSTGHSNTAWMNYLMGGNPPLVDPGTANTLVVSQELTQAKGGVRLSDFATFAQTLGANAIICVNGYTDTNPSSTAQYALAAQRYGLNVLEWELSNEPYLYPLLFPTAASYVAAMYSPYFTDLTSVVPGATVGMAWAGLFPGRAGDYTSWDTGMSSYAPQYWNAASIHVYPITTAVSIADMVKTLNGVLAHGTADYINSYLLPLIGANTPVFITELNCCTYARTKFLGFLYNGIFLAEYIARMSAVPNVKAVGVNSMYTDNYDYHGLIQSVDDFESYLIDQVTADPTFSTNTATDPNTPYQFYTSAPGLAVQVANQAINNSRRIWPTTVTGGSTVPILGYDGNPVPAIYAQAYLGNDGTPYLLITNKAAKAKNVTIQVNGTNIRATLSVTFVSNPNAEAANNAQAPNTVQIQTATSGNPLQVGPYSVTCVSW